MTATIQDFAKSKPTNARAQSNKCVIYTRVSSKEQADNNGSLETQMKYCEQYAISNKLEVVERFGGTYESAQSDDNRKEFQRMLAYVKKNQKVRTIIVYSLDRFSRTGSQASNTIEQLRAKGIEVKAVQQDFDTSNPSGKMMQEIMMVVARMDNDMRRDKCVTGMQEKLLKGYWIGPVPKGYKNLNPKSTADQQKFVITQEGKLIKRAFEMRAKSHGYQDIEDKLAPLGFTTKARHLGRIFSNPFYAGLIVSSHISGQVIKGNHPALISEAIFLKVNGKEPGMPQRCTTKHEMLPLKTFMKEEESGIPFTGYISKKGSIPYYKNRYKGKAVNINAKKVNEAFKEMLRQWSIHKDTSDILKDKVNGALNQKLKEQLELEKALVKIENDLESRLERLEEKFVNDEISTAIYHKHRLKIESEIVDNRKKLINTPFKSSNLEKAVEKGIELCRNPSVLWGSSDYMNKRNLQNIFFPEGILVSKEKRTVRTDRVNTVILEIARQQGDVAHKKTGNTDFEIVFSRYVAGTGLEPATFGL